MNTQKTSYWATLQGCLTLIVLAIAGFLLLRDHGMHLLQWVPFLLVLLCPLMHFFMHRGHRHEPDQRPDTSSPDYQRGYTDALRETTQQDSDVLPEQEVSEQPSKFH